MAPIAVTNGYENTMPAYARTLRDCTPPRRGCERIVYVIKNLLNMNYLINQCIYPIMDGIDDVGQGFFADGYFITAAHVVKQHPNCFIDIEGNIIKLSEMPIVLQGEGDVNKDVAQVDVAIYRYSYASPLHLSTYKPQQTDLLESHCMTVRYDNATGKYYNELDVKKATLLNREESNYFYCSCLRFGGSSGSPLLVGNQVVGIMHGGDGKTTGIESLGLCAFLKIESFLFPPDRLLVKRPKVTRAGYNTTDYDPYGHYNYNEEARKQLEDAFEGEPDTHWNTD